MELIRIILAISSLWIVACSTPVPPDKLTETDEVGRSVTVSIPAKTVISLAPNITEILFAIGAGDQTIGITDYCNYPPASQNRERVGGLTDPAIEKILTLKPELVLATADGNPRFLIGKLNEAGIPVYTINPQSLDGIYQSITTIGRLTGKQRGADSVLSHMKTILNSAPAVSDSPTVFLVLGTDPLISVAGGSYLDDAIRLAGLKNVVPSQENRYPLINPEALIVWNPDYLLMTMNASLSPDGRYQGLKAMQQGHFIQVDSDAFLRPGPRLADAIVSIRTAVHP